MKCPTCPNVNLTMSERQGIEIDYCPECRGVWLDRGELDKIIERSAGTAQTQQPQAPPPSRDYPKQGSYGHDPYHRGGHYKKKKREGFLSDLFDFD